MSEIVVVPGGTVTFRDATSVSERLRRPVVRLQMRLAGSPLGELLASRDRHSDAEFEALLQPMLGSDDYALLEELNDAAAVALVEAWSFPPAVTLDGLLDLPGPVYDAIRAQAAKRMPGMLPSFAPDPDEASPTPPSAG